jgi:hypothetical protein
MIQNANTFLFCLLGCYFLNFYERLLDRQFFTKLAKVPVTRSLCACFLYERHNKILAKTLKMEQHSDTVHSLLCVVWPSYTIWLVDNAGMMCSIMKHTVTKAGV